MPEILQNALVSGQTCTYECVALSDLKSLEVFSDSELDAAVS